MLLLAVVGLRFWIGKVGPFPGDHWAAVRFDQPWLRRPFTKDIASFYQSLGSPVPALAIGALGLVLVWLQREPGAFGGLVIACLAVPVNGLFKLAFGPTALWLETGRTGTNFPSGHVSFVTAVIGYMGLLCWRSDRRWLTALAVVLIAGVGPARVAGGEHLVSDVLGGYMLGLALLILAGLWLEHGGLRLIFARAHLTRARGRVYR